MTEIERLVDVFLRLVEGNRFFHRMQLEEYLRVRLSVQRLREEDRWEALRHAELRGAKREKFRPDLYLLPRPKKPRKTRCKQTGDLFGGK